ncbi:MAG: class I SAM-dependent methyltransferase, partial [Desulfomicrobiaceae bacterium]
YNLELVEQPLPPGDPEAYRYLAQTIAAFPHEEALAQELEEAGFTLIRYTPMASGIVFLHEASRPA